RSLVGSEMCIRDRVLAVPDLSAYFPEYNLNCILIQGTRFIIDSRTSAIPKINKFYSGLNSDLAHFLQKSGVKVILKKSYP
ncbi:hypothetical protein, partial [Methanosarcina sp. 2.H.T.1A.8]|uniref:hypothetical protein n=1 Tax=Methanosarcina sp. 2.H.T.1A.8 TaxID=1483598 RepID=UPI00062232B5